MYITASEPENDRNKINPISVLLTDFNSDADAGDPQKVNQRWKYCVGLVVLLAIIAIVIAIYYVIETENNCASTTEHTELNQQINQILIENGISGCSIHSIQNGVSVYSHLFGYKNLDATEYKDKIFTTNSLMKIASVTKPMIGVAMELLLNHNNNYNEHNYSWNSTIYDVINDDSVLLTEFSKYYTLNEYMHNITLIHLISHQSGIRHYYTTDEWRWKGLSNIDDDNTNYIQYLKIFGNDTLTFEPGNGYQYTSYGYILIAILMEKISNQSFYHFMKNSLLEPLNLYNTIDYTIDDDNDEVEIAIQYQRYCDIVASSYNNLSSCYFKLPPESNQPLPAGGFWSNAMDIASFGYKVYFTNFLSDKMKSNIFTGQIQLSNNRWYSLGWNQNVELNPTNMWHSGGAIGGRIQIEINVEKQMSTAVLCNTQSITSVVSAVIDAVQSYF